MGSKLPIEIAWNVYLYILGLHEAKSNEVCAMPWGVPRFGTAFLTLESSILKFIEVHISQQSLVESRF